MDLRKKRCILAIRDRTVQLHSCLANIYQIPIMKVVYGPTPAATELPYIKIKKLISYPSYLSYYFLAAVANSSSDWLRTTSLQTEAVAENSYKRDKNGSSVSTALFIMFLKYSYLQALFINIISAEIRSRYFKKDMQCNYSLIDAIKYS